MTALERILEQPIKEALPLLREHLRACIESGESPADDLRVIAEREPLALGELVVGPKAIPGPAMVLGALAQIEVLEDSIAPKALYQRLLSLGGEAGKEVLELAVRRHASAGWLVGLSIAVEGDEAGLCQLRAVSDSPDFIGICEAYAQAGATGGLEHMAGSLARLEPVMALARVGDLAPLARAAASLLCADPEQPVLAWISAIRGPDLDDLVLAMIPHLRSGASIRSLRAQARACPRSLLRLNAVCASIAN